MDILGDAAEPGFDEEVEDPTPGFFSEPSTLAFIAFPLSILVILGAQVFRGITYTFAMAPGSGLRIVGDEQFQQGLSYLSAGAFLSAAFSLIPLGLGYRGLTRLIAEDPAWVGALLRASVVLAGLSFVLHLISAVLVTANQGSASTVYLGLS